MDVKEEKSYVFNSIHTVAKYLHFLSPAISPVKLHKSLYFLFAYYGALYANKEKEGVSEKKESTPSMLFEAEFEAWTYGSVNREVYLQSKEEGYFSESEIEEAVEIVHQHIEAKQYINEMFEQMNAVSDFGLISRNKQDKAWKDAYEEGKIHVINQEQLIQEYQERYL
ncbi:hypothetical protein CVD28_00410 [Bacillus sp. M6-12]|uniref:Panacea domain-containing protein n=1 Tax=Bacillus sp. M6-12 TaxID=2054166 RepID=UPI000C782FC5|nr:hypothetical protein [Bacillus sp. M6-12]PLS18897.1 hypothetical protein CVD28_00410 [Bacillus sp. M6-12]